MRKAFDEKSMSFQVCCPGEIRIASDFSVKFGINIFKFAKYGRVSNVTFESYDRPSDWWRSIGFLDISFVSERLEMFE